MLFNYTTNYRNNMLLLNLQKIPLFLEERLELPGNGNDLPLGVIHEHNARLGERDLPPRLLFAEPVNEVAAVFDEIAHRDLYGHGLPVEALRFIDDRDVRQYDPGPVHIELGEAEMYEEPDPRLVREGEYRVVPQMPAVVY